MSSILKYLENHPLETQRLLGLKSEQLNNLVNNAIELHHKKISDIESQKIRVIAGGGGRKKKLSEREQIILTLIYLRHLTTFQLLGIQFEVSETTANDIFNYWFPLLKELLPCSILEQVKKNESDNEVVKEILTEFDLIVDSYEQNIERPQDYLEQKKYYSGKKKNHTFKNQLIILPEGKDIVEVTVGKKGPQSDINIFRESKKNYHECQKFKGDKAYLGDPNIKTPYKKTKTKQLTEEQKEKNKELSSSRIFVEHTIRLVKIFRVAQERFRLSKEKYGEIILTICGLIRLRIGALILQN